MGEQIKISPIFYMGNKKKLIKKGLCDLFPNDINTFIDLFGGSGIVGMNVNANRYILNDGDENLYNFYQMFKDNTPQYIIEKVLNNINKFNMLRTGVKQNTEESNIYKKRYEKMRENANNSKKVEDLYSCIFYAFSQQMRFNKNGKFNMPFGNGSFTKQNEEYIKQGCDFFHSGIQCTNKDFRELKIEKLNSNDFVYLDCPYLNTTATYNENGGWSIQDDYDLFELCERLDKNNIKWGISNVFENKGTINQHLIDWCKNNRWEVYTFDSHTYMACGKGNSKAKEVYICNYIKEN